MRHSAFLRAAAAVVLLAYARAYAGAATFQDVFPGARAQGMGYSYASVADDSDAMFYNPAGLALVAEPELSLATARHLVSNSNIGLFSASMARPSERLQDSVIGAGFLSERQTNVVARDGLLLAFAASRPMTFLEDFLPGMAVLPGRWGANLRLESLRPEVGNAKAVVGLDAGIQIGARDGARFGASLMQFQSDTTFGGPYLTLGASYPFGRFRCALDVRSRSGLTELFPGVEATFLGGLLQARAGRGASLGDADGLSLGLGVDYSPVTFNVAMTFPVQSFGREAGSYNLAFGYRFGGKSFIEKFAGRTSEELRLLDQRVREQTDRLRRLQDARDLFRTERDAARAELEQLDERLKAANRNLTELERAAQREVVKRDRLEPVPARAPAPRRVPKGDHDHSRPRATRWALPRDYKVRDGDTLRSIASRFYGDPHLWEYIYDANPETIRRGLPTVGTTIRIPAPPEDAKRAR